MIRVWTPHPQRLVNMSEPAVTSTALPQPKLPHVVVIGGGFAGIKLVRSLKKAPVRITLIDRQNHHLFQPLLYQVATAGLGAPDISQPIREIVRGQDNCTVILGEVSRIDVQAQTVGFENETLHYDYLYVATGATHSYFGNDQWAPRAPGLKNLQDAMDIRRRVIMAYERAERATSEAERRRELTFVVVGAGPTGVELAGALAEISQRTMARNFRNFEPSSANVLLVEASPRVLGAYHEKLSASAVRQLEDLGVKVLLNTRVNDVDEEGVQLNDTHVPAGTILWAAGVKSSPLGQLLGVPLDRSGRVIVNPDLSVPTLPNVSVLGDLAAVSTGEEGKFVPGLAPAATQMGEYAAKRLRRQLKGRETEPFSYLDKGQMATIGMRRAVAQSGSIRFSGYFAWLAWVFIHVLFLIGFRNRVAVMLDWVWSYYTQRRGARILWGVPAHEAAPRAYRALIDNQGAGHEIADPSQAGAVQTSNAAHAATGDELAIPVTALEVEVTSSLFATDVAGAQRNVEMTPAAQPAIEDVVKSMLEDDDGTSREAPTEDHPVVPDSFGAVAPFGSTIGATVVRRIEDIKPPKA